MRVCCVRFRYVDRIKARTRIDNRKPGCSFADDEGDDIDTETGGEEAKSLWTTIGE